MKKKGCVLAVTLVLGAVISSPVLALAPMGPPTAGLKQGQLRAGIDYSYSKMDLELSWPGESDYTIDDFKTNMIFANIGYGIADNWEAFVRLGVANTEFDGVLFPEGGESDVSFDGGYEFAFGFGTKVTWAKQENLDWGALFQMHWMNGQDDWAGVVPDGNTVTDDLDLDLYEIQIAVGPTYKMDKVSIYGGPFLHFVDGDADWEGTYGVLRGKESGDVQQESEFGGYVGAQVDLAENTSLFGEVQMTGDAWSAGVGVGWRF